MAPLTAAGRGAVLNPIAQLKHKIDVAAKTAACAVIVGAALLVALGFFCAAAFIAIAQAQGAIAAALILGGAFVVVALIAVLIAMVLRRRNPPPPPPSARPWWNDPAMIATALDITRTFGRGRTTAAVLVSALLAGMMLGKSPGKREK